MIAEKMLRMWLFMVASASAFRAPGPIHSPLLLAKRGSAVHQLHALPTVSAFQARVPQPIASLALPSIGAAAIWPTAAASGAAAVAAQLMLTAGFKRSSDKAVSSTAGLLAYRIVAFVYTLLLTVVGGALFLNPANWPGSAATAMSAANGTVRFIGAVLFGELLLWDIPCAIWIKKLRRPDLLAHHIGLAVGPALVAMRFLPLFYYAWFIGFSEASSVFLAGNDFFAELHDAVQKTDGESSSRLPGLAQKRDAFQIGAALTFVAVRVCGWAWLVWLLFRDTLAVLPLAVSVGTRTLLRLQLGMAAGFYALQLYWFSKLVAYARGGWEGGSQDDAYN